MPNPQKHWKEQYEDAGTDEKQRYVKAGVEKLLQTVQKGQFGSYYQIWYALAEIATLEQAGWPLYTILTANIDYLNRYHAANALLQLFAKKGLNAGFEPVDLSGNRANLPANLAQVRALLLQHLGEPPTNLVQPFPAVQPHQSAQTAQKPQKWYEKIFKGSRK